MSSHRSTSDMSPQTRLDRRLEDEEGRERFVTILLAGTEHVVAALQEFARQLKEDPDPILDNAIARAELDLTINDALSLSLKLDGKVLFRLGNMKVQTRAELVATTRPADNTFDQATVHFSHLLSNSKEDPSDT